MGGWRLGFVVLLGLVIPIAPTWGAPLDRVVAIIGAPTLTQEEIKEEIITQSEVDELAKPMLAKMTATPGEPVDPTKVNQRVLEELIMRKLRFQESNRLRIIPSDAELQAVVTQMEQKNSLPAGGLEKALVKQGMSVSSFRQEVADQMIKGRLVNKLIRPFVSVSEDEIQELFRTEPFESRGEEIHLGQILLALDQNAKPEKIQEVAKQAEKLLGQLKRGTPMINLASQYSEGPNALKGGEMGWFKRGQLPPELEKAVFDRPAGAVVGPVRSPQGVHIFQVIERRAGGRDQTISFQVKASHILIKVPTNAGSDVVTAKQELIKDIRNKLDAGTPFEELARKHSEDSSASDGGKLGWFGAGLMVPEFEAVAFKMKKGEISQPVRSSFGWHLIHLEDRRDVAANSLDARRGELEQRVRDAKTQARFNQWMRDVRLRAYVELR